MITPPRGRAGVPGAAGASENRMRGGDRPDRPRCPRRACSRCTKSKAAGRPGDGPVVPAPPGRLSPGRYRSPAAARSGAWSCPPRATASGPVDRRGSWPVTAGCGPVTRGCGRVSPGLGPAVGRPGHGAERGQRPGRCPACAWPGPGTGNPLRAEASVLLGVRPQRTRTSASSRRRPLARRSSGRSSPQMPVEPPLSRRRLRRTPRRRTARARVRPLESAAQARGAVRRSRA